MAGNDEQAVFAECRAALIHGRVISDGCARTIAALWHGGQASRAYAFASTGAIVADPYSDDPADMAEATAEAPAELWRELFGPPAAYADLSADWRRAADQLRAYLTDHGARGPQPGWSSLWVR